MSNANLYPKKLIWLRALLLPEKERLGDHRSHTLVSETCNETYRRASVLTGYFAVRIKKIMLES